MQISLKNIIPNYDKWEKIIYINKGLSSDKKFFLQSKTQKKYIIRISKVKELNNKINEYNAVKKIKKLNFIQKFLGYGICENKEFMYSIYSWLQGENLEEKIFKLTKRKQYELGFQAGKKLRKIHTLTITDTNYNFIKEIKEKVNISKKEYVKNKYKIKNEKIIWNFINKNLYLLDKREKCFLHGDFHIGNIILNKDKELGFIDLNWFRYGDPYKDFVKLVYVSRMLSVNFSIGQINGYFDNKVPEIFFKVLALYTAINVHFSILWSSKLEKKELNKDLKRIQKVYNDYSGFKLIIPKWYTKPNDNL
ncbi:hypothetical protein EII29_02380 [Leptotrichia sp. OH3620_COT-345]|uniref:aminoglycoside phosphotransferase family protein n=1 Tax=Leptotrichia sp. OH3620_COT-345 TaxID=2491048 RepID=UPI000F6502D2|nr:phosphotransferase [Leptotrichia sp. OH3620_COT-345]RRD40345.1 hypothetical protein EII29_02380 [Leptotrichia sp. OH3620_COT-345]